MKYLISYKTFKTVEGTKQSVLANFIEMAFLPSVDVRVGLNGMITTFNLISVF